MVCSSQRSPEPECSLTHQHFERVLWKWQNEEEVLHYITFPVEVASFASMGRGLLLIFGLHVQRRGLAKSRTPLSHICFASQHSHMYMCVLLFPNSKSLRTSSYAGVFKVSSHGLNVTGRNLLSSVITVLYWPWKIIKSSGNCHNGYVCVCVYINVYYISR